MELFLWRVIVDFGLLVLIWMVQLVVYPSFSYYAKDDLMRWHPRYTSSITFIVAPLMFIQTGIIAYQCFLDGLLIQHIVSAALLASVWLLTFLVAVPLHQKIEKGTDYRHFSHKLVGINWWRTAAWTLLWLISLGAVVLQ